MIHLFTCLTALYCNLSLFNLTETPYLENYVEKLVYDSSMYNQLSLKRNGLS
jgi:hypothetical protein